MLRTFTAGLVLLCGWHVALAADTPSKDEAAIRAMIDSYTAAYNRGDAKAVAAHWGETAEWISPDGKRVQGRPAIEKEFAALFAANKAMRVEILEPSIRLITPDVAMEEGTAIVSQQGEVADGSTYIAIHVKKDGQWKLDSVRETALPAAASEEEGLEQLAWMVGEWVDHGSDATIETNVAWAKNHAFLTCAFRVATSEEDDLEGNLVIGWDSAAKTIRSWMFDSDGGFGQGVWTRKENRWIVSFTQVLADGRQASSTNIYTYVDPNNYTWQSIHRLVDGESLPDVAETKIVRAAGAEAPKPSEATEAKPAEAKAAKPAEPKGEKPAETKAAKPAETKASKPAETKASKPAETKSGKPAETKATKPTETKPAKPAEKNKP